MALILRAVAFAAGKHQNHRRKGSEGTPYINHPIEVAELLWNVGRVRDPELIAGAMLHDTIEDTDATPEEIEARFGAPIRRLVEEMTDDKRLPKQERKRLQVERAPAKSDRAKTLSLADKICNVRDIAEFPPSDWSLERKREYLDWARRVVAGLRGGNAILERHFAEVVARTSEELDKEEGEQ